MKFYKQENNLWVVGELIIPSGTCKISVYQEDSVVDISFINGVRIFNEKITELTDVDDIAYADIADFLTRCGYFFTNPFVRLEETVDGLVNYSLYADIDFPIIIRTIGPGQPILTTFNGNLLMPQWKVGDFNMCESQELIHEWKEGTQVNWHLHYTTNGTDATDRYVKFELEYAYTINGTWTFPSIFTTDDILIPANTPDKTQIIMPITTFTPSDSKISDHILPRLKRVASAGAAPSGDPWIPMLQVHILKDSVGSREIGTK